MYSTGTVELTDLRTRSDDAVMTRVRESASAAWLCRAEPQEGHPARRTGGMDAFQPFVVKVGLLHLESATPYVQPSYLSYSRTL